MRVLEQLARETAQSVHWDSHNSPGPAPEQAALALTLACLSAVDCTMDLPSTLKFSSFFFFFLMDMGLIRKEIQKHNKKLLNVFTHLVHFKNQ